MKTLTEYSHDTAAFNFVGRYLFKDGYLIEGYPMDFFCHDFKTFQEAECSIVIRVYDYGTHVVEIDGTSTDYPSYFSRHPKSFGGLKCRFIKFMKDNRKNVVAYDMTDEWRLRIYKNAEVS